jgi:uncharacterized protein (TIGR02270 family)
VMMSVALAHRAMPAVARLIDRVIARPALSRGLISAMGWAPWDSVAPVLRGLVFPKISPALHFLGIAGFGVNRRDPGAALGFALESDDPRLRARALRTVGQCGRADLLDASAAQIASGDHGCRFAAAWTAALWDRPPAVTALWEIARAGEEHANEAVSMAVRTGTIADANHQLVGLRDDHPDVALAGAATLGDPANLDWVLEWLDDPPLARQAADAMGAITGLDWVEEKLVAPSPRSIVQSGRDGSDAPPISGDDDGPWPDVARLRAWWCEKQTAYTPGVRHLAGKPLCESWLERVLRHGAQPQRRSAAIERSRWRPGAPLFEVRAPAFQQRVRLG